MKNVYFTCIMGTLHEHLYTFMKISRRTLLRIRIASDKVVEKVKTHTLCSIFFSPPKIVPYMR